MRRLCVGLTLFSLIALAGTPLRADDLLFSRFGDYLESIRAQSGIPGLYAAIVGDSGIVWERAFGQQDVDRSIATSGATAFHVDGLMESVAATMILRCVEDGRVSLDDPVSRYSSDTPDGNATLRDVLTHTSGPRDNLTYAYRPERLAPVAGAIAACTGQTFRGAVAAQLDRLAMFDSAPGPDAAQLVPPADDVTAADIDRYLSVLGRLATPYAVDKRGKASVSQYAPTTLTVNAGLVTTARDLARFDVALRSGVLIRPDTLAAAWRAPVDRNGQPLPHGIGWFVQTYNQQAVAWQFGVEDNATSAFMLTVPGRSLTLILTANSDGLVRSLGLTAGDVSTSPFAKAFLGLVVR
jgi:CubicO group peptidase (beta-lactamase class C family)